MNPDSRKIRLILALRRNGITDTRVLGIMEKIARDAFVPVTFRDQAYDDTTLPIGRHQTISQPSVVAKMTQALDVGDRMKVLEIGTGSGYQAAILAGLCRRLYTIERHRELLEMAKSQFSGLRITNITTRLGDGMQGWPEQAPFDRILVTAAASQLPEKLADQLAVGGIMVAPVGDPDGDQTLVRVRRTEDGFEKEPVGTVRFVPLVPGVAGE
ncbi:MAG: protein-L-isoaspartate(D-aspartate) O-methyltransferase [Rhodospirillales bacterium]|nr:protein-L-isoaspartate(D-aspartate) O-methyltransferase [Rhodospirillales bacterium]